MDTNIDYDLLPASLYASSKLNKLEITFMAKAKKFHRTSSMNKSDDRILVLSKTHLYLFTRRKLHTLLPISLLIMIIKSQQSKEFILQFESGEELRLTCEYREDFLILLKLRFANIADGKPLQVYGLPQPSLKDQKNINLVD